MKNAEKIFGKFATFAFLLFINYLYTGHSGRAVFALSNTGIVGSNPTQGMDICLRLFCVCVVLCSYLPCSGLIPRTRSPTDSLRIKKLKGNKAFHGCPMFQSGSKGKKRVRERERITCTHC
jgi:hypothetical protein